MPNEGYKLSKGAVQRTAKAVREVLGGVGSPSRRPVPTRRRDRGGVGKKYELLTGVVSGYDSTNKVATLSATPTQLPTGAKALPTGSVKVYNIHGITVNESDVVYAIHQKGVYDDTAGSNTHGVLDWRMLPFTGSDTTKTLNFVLYEDDKKWSESSATCKLCDASFNPIGDAITIYDPHQQFSSGGETDSRGRCTLVRDADTGDTRLEMTHLEGPALYICATLTEDVGATTSGKASADVDDYHGIGWWKNDPGESVNVVSCNGMHDNLKSGAKVIALLSDPDAATLEYTIVENVVSSTSLIAKITTTVSARSGDTYGTGTAALGHPVDGDWVQVHEEEEILNPSNLEIEVPSGFTIHCPVALINGAWVLTGALELLSLSSYAHDTEQHISKCEDGLPEWQNGSPIIDIRVTSNTIDVLTPCTDWTTIHTGVECPEPEE